jgi:hypothetical protein
MRRFATSWFEGVGRATAKVVLPALLVLSLAGCQRLDQAKECRSIARLVNPVLEIIDRERQQFPNNASAHRAIAARYEAIGAAVAEVPIATAHLKEAVSNYERLTRDAARTARAFADAVDSNDPARIASVRGAAAREAKREGSVLAQFDAMCRTR